MRLPALDDRLSRAAALFPACEYGADIGADHGRLSCHLLGVNCCERMCVADISADSLEKAKNLLLLHGLSHRADITVGDGLFVLDRPAQAIAILGMGGHTLSGILERGKEKLKGAALVLSAHTQLSLVRKTLMELEYTIETEEIAYAGGRHYVVLRARPGKSMYSEKEMFLGPMLMHSENLEHYADYLSWRIGLTQCKKNAEGERELKWLKEEYARVCHSGNDSESDQ